MPTDLKTSGTADEDFAFSVIPYDKFDNLVDVKESDVNLKVTFPGSSTANSYKSTKDPVSLKLNYLV